MDLDSFLPYDLAQISDVNRSITQISKNDALISMINEATKKVQTTHKLYCADSRNADFVRDNSVHLVLTSPPYWTLKRYREVEGQLGHVSDYNVFLSELKKIWKICYDALVPGGRLVCVVGDVCLSRRKNNGEHTVIPLHAAIQQQCLDIGFRNLSPIIWHKISNATYEVKGNSRFLGKPYEPNGIIKNDIEFILMLRKPGGYRSVSKAKRILSVIPDRSHKMWFNQIWEGLNGVSTKEHPAPFPLSLADRLIRMFSFVGDTVLDPFMGSGTTNIAAALSGRDSIGIEIDPVYFQKSLARFNADIRTKDFNAKLEEFSMGDVDNGQV